MKRSVVAAIIVVFLFVPAWAQRGGHGGGGSGFHGGGGFAGGMSGGGFAGHGGGMSGGGFASHGFSGGGFSGVHSGFHGPGYAPNGGNWGWHGNGWGNHVHHYYYSRTYYGYPRYAYPYYGYGYGYGLPLYAYDDSGYGQQYDPSANYATPDVDQEQQAEIERLEEEVARLRAERGGAQDAPAPRAQKSSGPVTASTPETAVLVYRDKHTEVIDNYAIMGKTVYVFNDDRSKRVSMAALDIPATEKANEARGVELHLGE
jgi:hypothetical protein